MKQIMTSLLMVVAMAGASCTGNAQNKNGGNASVNDTTIVVPKDSVPQNAEDSICNNPDVRPKYDTKGSVTFLLDFLNKNLH